MPSRETKRRIDPNVAPLVSVVTPVYNAQKFVGSCIDSVLAQSYPNWEMLIVDDASKDQSAVIIKQYAESDNRIKLTSLKENRGAAYCRNLATEQARGEYIAFLDADDVWFPQKLQTQLDLMYKEECKVCFSSYTKIDESGRALGIMVEALASLTFEKELRNNYVGNLTGIYNAEALGKIIAPNIRKRQDWAVWLEAISRSAQPAVGIKEPLAAYRVHQESISANKMGLLKYNYAFYREHLGYSSVRSTYMMCCFLAEYFFNRPKLIRKID